AYRQFHRVCPRFSAEAFLRAMTHIHRVAYVRYRATQFRSAYDCFLAIMRTVSSRVDKVMKRGDSWKAANACAPCLYELDGETPLAPRILAAMDGNNSLKLIDDTFRKGNTQQDSRSLQSWRWLEVDYVNHFASEVADAQARTKPPSDVVDDSTDDVAWLNEIETKEVNTCVNTCVERWKNLGPEARKKMLSLFSVSGIFLCVCRHGHVLVMCDMIRSGELMKYPLAIVDHLLKTYGPDFGLGYDIMCAFFKTLQKSTLAPRVAALRLRGVVPAFHGHAHNRGCQVSWHPMYAVGVGIEDFEECERTFCKSNELAGVTRMATSFHRRQQLVEHFDFHDMDKHAASGNFIYQNYRQVIERLASDQPALDLLRERTGTTAIDQENDLKDERLYLQGLRHEPDDEVMAADYIELLETLYKLDSLGYTARQVTGIRTWATTAIAKYAAHHDMVVDFELQHSIETRWLPDSTEYQQAVKVVEQRRYRRALDNLERLVVQRFFELTKLNQSGVGYKQRRKLGQALRARAQAIRNAIDAYNAAAKLMRPARRLVSWNDVLDMATLGEFDLLRDTRQDISRLPWARPDRREAMRLHFGLQRAREELVRLHVEIRRLVTFMIDEFNAYRTAYYDALASDPTLAYEIYMRLEFSNNVNSRISRRLSQTAALPGFSGTLHPGTRRGVHGFETRYIPLWATEVLKIPPSAQQKASPPPHLPEVQHSPRDVDDPFAGRIAPRPSALNGRLEEAPVVLNAQSGEGDDEDEDFIHDRDTPDADAVADILEKLVLDD
ncbi:hypothetical protein K523DRAFT_256164, partial [Schizophyllum commune Tattone D]